MNLHLDDTDVALVALLTAGDKKAFEAIYRKYASDLYRYARKNIPLKEDCEEIIQDIFESLWVRYETLQVKTLRSYLFNMVRYKVIRYCQHKTVRKKYADHYRLFEAVYDNVNEAERDTTSTYAMIEKSISKLPERCQVAVKLRLDENLSNGDIAKRMNITKKTVEMYMFKAFSHLRSSYPNMSIE